MAILY